jgi:hypothetical protein
MRQMILMICVAGLCTACNNSATSKDDSKTTDAKVANASDQKMDYAYTIEHPDQWEMGSKMHTQTVLASLKAFENGDMEAATKDFADTVQLLFDGFDAKVSRDSAKAILTQSRKQNKSMKVIMDDFESVKSKDGTAEYVSLWYKEKTQDQKGTWDSLSVMDDLRIKDGKIASIDEKVRHYPKKKM